MLSCSHFVTPGVETDYSASELLALRAITSHWPLYHQGPYRCPHARVGYAKLLKFE